MAVAEVVKLPAIVATTACHSSAVTMIVRCHRAPEPPSQANQRRFSLDCPMSNLHSYVDPDVPLAAMNRRELMLVGWINAKIDRPPFVTSEKSSWSLICT